MLFQSTRAASLTIGFAQGLLKGLAPDGGLFVPSQWPALSPRQIMDKVGDLAPEQYLTPEGLARIGALLLEPFAADSVLAPQLSAVTRQAFSFPAPLAQVLADDHLSVLELFHGPTAAFKDFGARFLAAAMPRLRPAGARQLKILVATSGDTGGAVAAAFHRQPGVEVAVLFPKGLVSPTQEHQLTCWGDNVRSFAVRGTFDDCQAMVKQAFADPALSARFDLSSANSINLGRLLPQAVYYAASSLCIFARHGEKASYVVPSGNLGNVVAGLWARRVGMPIDSFVLAHNANRTVPELLETGEFQPRPSVTTLASAMDVGNPSNLTRLRALYPDIGQLRGAISADWVSDEAIRTRIHQGFVHFGQIWCPHTATAAEVYERMPLQKRETGRWVLVSTAHPAKFREIVEPLIGQRVSMPESLGQLYDLPSQVTEIDADLAALSAGLG